MGLDLDKIKRKAIIIYLGLMLDKAVVYNCKQSRYNSGRGIRNAFERHDFSYKWSFSEFDSSINLLPWVTDQISGAYRGIAELGNPLQISYLNEDDRGDIDNKLRIIRGSASRLDKLESGSIDHINLDPPYYDNVQYAELSDFFYVWLKRSVGHLLPKYFRDELTNKDDEAVANPARFKELGKNKRKLAEKDYQRKMELAFQELNRVLTDDGVMTVMFTHKKVKHGIHWLLQLLMLVLLLNHLGQFTLKVT